MVDHAAHSAYPGYLSETIQFQAPANTRDTREIASLHLDSHLSTAQIAERVGCSKAYVILILKRAGLLRPKTKAQTNPLNYRNPVAPYGYRLVDGKLAPDSKELKVCRLIVDLMARQGFSSLKTAQYLTQKGAKNRRGASKWHNYTVSRIYARWKGRL